MRKILSFCIVLVFLFSCSKKSEDVENNTPNPPVTTPVDTLSAGWSQINAPQNEMEIFDIFFTDNQSGYTVGQKGIYKSINAGDSWLQVLNNIQFLNIASFGIKSVFTSSQNKPYNTQNGSTFNASGLTPGISDNTFYDCFFSSNSVCYASSRNAAYKSVDGGLTFSQTQIFNDDASVTSLSFLNDNLGYLGRLNKLYKTVDGGINWIPINISTFATITSIEFISPNLIYYGTNAGVFKSIDGGINFLSVFTISNNAFTDIEFINASIGYLCYGSQIFKTIDAGANWTKVVGVTGTNFVELHFTDINHGWACGGGKVYRYSN